MTEKSDKRNAGIGQSQYSPGTGTRGLLDRHTPIMAGCPKEVTLAVQGSAC